MYLDDDGAGGFRTEDIQMYVSVVVIQHSCFIDSLQPLQCAHFPTL